MDIEEKDVVYTYQECHNIPFTATEVVVETSPHEEEEEVCVTDEMQVYEDMEYYVEVEVPHAQNPRKLSKHPHIRRRQERGERIRLGVSSEEIDTIDIGKSVILGAADRSVNQQSMEKSIRSGLADTHFLGEISISSLVEGMMCEENGDDARFAMVGNSIMWNALKSKMRDTKSNIMMRTAQSYAEPRFDGIDLHMQNLIIHDRNPYEIRSHGVFANADLRYIFSTLLFRNSARLLNKTKQFLKAYFIVACRPRCMIWRYTLRRKFNSHKKTILNLPSGIVQVLAGFLMDLTGIGAGDVPFEKLDPSMPLYQSLGEDEMNRKQRYLEMQELRDSLWEFFRNAITDVLNEIREMSFSLQTGHMITPLRGRAPVGRQVTWRDYEGHLNREHHNPSEVNYQKRVKFEQKLCEIVPR